MLSRMTDRIKNARLKVINVFLKPIDKTMYGIHRHIITRISNESPNLLKQAVCSRIRAERMAERFEALEMANDVRRQMLSDYVVIRGQTRPCPTPRAVLLPLLPGRRCGARSETVVRSSRSIAARAPKS